MWSFRAAFLYPMDEASALRYIFKEFEGTRITFNNRTYEITPDVAGHVYSHILTGEASHVSNTECTAEIESIAEIQRISEKQFMEWTKTRRTRMQSTSPSGRSIWTSSHGSGSAL